jgi:tripartite-type tricarboxylate transporter receptor subunit TctC
LRFGELITLLAALFSIPVAAQAQGYPNHFVRVIVPYQAGGTVDIAGRIVARKLSESLGQALVIDNRPGANGMLGTSVAATAGADGYTLLLVAANHVVNPSLYKNMTYDPIADFTPVSMLGFSRNALAVNSSLPVKSVKELIAFAKAQPGKINFSSTGSGSFPHLNGTLFKLRAGIDVVDVPYKGAPGALTALISGEVAFSFLTITNAIAQRERVRLLAVTGEQRSPAIPELPTMTEAGLSGLETNAWMAFLSPAGTPRHIVQMLNAEIGKALTSEEVKSSLAPQGVEISHGTPEQLGSTMKLDLAKWGDVLRRAGVTPN